MGAPARRSGAPERSYGEVVLSVNVSVLLYAPVRSASLAPMSWLNAIAAASLETGAGVGLDDRREDRPPAFSGWAARTCR